MLRSLTLIAAAGLASHGVPVPSPAAAPNAARASCATGAIGARTSHSLAYDAVRRQVVVFGGASSDTSDALPRSLWAWNGHGWRCLSADGPPGRADAFLVFDGVRNRLVLFGGRVFEPNRRMRFMRDTWEWDGTRWTPIDTAGSGGESMVLGRPHVARDAECSATSPRHVDGLRRDPSTRHPLRRRGRDRHARRHVGVGRPPVVAGHPLTR